jgi:PTH1 family peptidyl-tRNA hydrolase
MGASDESQRSRLLVVGLGNPGRGYASHRHNVGFMALDELARRASADSFREKFSGEWTRAEVAGREAIFLKPMTYMNESGRSVQPTMAFFKIALADVLVLHDELDLPFGDVRLKLGGGHAGHNGLRSIMACVGGDFARVRIGIGRPPAGFQGEVADFVLSSFDAGERTALPAVLATAVDAVLDVARRGLAAAMNARNARPKPKPEKPKQEKPKQEQPTADESATGTGDPPAKLPS